MTYVAAALYLFGMVVTRSYIDMIARVWPERFARHTPAVRAAATWICTTAWAGFACAFFVYMIARIFKERPRWPR